MAQDVACTPPLLLMIGGLLSNYRVDEVSESISDELDRWIDEVLV